MEVQEVKNIVSTARDLLVGKVPLPVDQCQEITRALIYKFLSAEDAASVGLGGEPSYFTGQRAECRWDALMSPERTANEVDRRYREGMAMLGRADVMPAIRTIYQDAYIPYNDPIILRDFLRAIDRFDTDDTEKIGDAYEMLLQDLGAQASAGQFRTPRHVIDFIVAVIDPQKHETVLDPACGTGGFLASTWEHINRAGRLSAADRGNLARNLGGYDISPTMAMLSTVNLFLHHQQQPVVSVYDTLTSEDKWNDHYDVILANPPFMSPKGGIRPHGRFFSKSRRSEVLFVDYIMGHLNEGGRAGVIVPEGVIFQSQRAHTQLRRLLVESALAAVVSLPAGVFQPYSGVKTSILILDKTLARRADGIAFFKVANDGYDLGAQRRPIAANDLPTVQAELREYLRRLRAGESLDDFAPQTGLIVAKDRIANGGDYNLSGERYRENQRAMSSWPVVKVSDVFHRPTENVTPSSLSGPVTYVGLENISTNSGQLVGETVWDNPENIKSAKSVFRTGDVLYGRLRPNLNKVWVADREGICSTDILVVRPSDTAVEPCLYGQIMRSQAFNAAVLGRVSGAQLPRISWQQFKSLEIPLPPLEVQREIVAEIEGYQRVIDGARAVVDNWQPRIAVDPEWPTVPLYEACDIQRGKFAHRPRNEPRFYDGNYPFIQTGDVTRANGGKIHYTQTLNDEGLAISRLFQPPVVVITIAANIGDTAVLDFPCCFPDSVVGLLPNDKTDVWFLELVMRTKKEYLAQIAPQAAQKNINVAILKTLAIPLPPLATQQAIVAEIEAERALVSANRELAQRMEGRIAGAVGRVWGE